MKNIIFTIFIFREKNLKNENNSFSEKSIFFRKYNFSINQRHGKLFFFRLVRKTEEPKSHTRPN